MQSNVYYMKSIYYYLNVCMFMTIVCHIVKWIEVVHLQYVSNLSCSAGPGQLQGNVTARTRSAGRAGARAVCR